MNMNHKCIFKGDSIIRKAKMRKKLRRNERMSTCKFMCKLKLALQLQVLYASRIHTQNSPTNIHRWRAQSSSNSFEIDI